MKQGKFLVALAALPMVFAGCDMLDVLKADALEAPSIQLSGRVVYERDGQKFPFPVRAIAGNQLRIWHTSWEAGDTLRSPTTMAIHMFMDGTYTGLVYPGTYDLQLNDVSTAGPWVNDTTRIPLVVNGDMQVPDITVVPYYTIQEDSIWFTGPTNVGADTLGTVNARFKVRQHATTAPLVELVGLYVSTTTFVDNTRRETTLLVQTNPAPPTGQSATNPHERVRTQVLTQLATNPSQFITISLRVPDALFLTRSPDPRTKLYARVGVKPVGITERTYSQIKTVSIAP